MGGACSTNGERIGTYTVLVRNLRERAHLENSVLDGKVILGWTVMKWFRWVRTGLIWLRIATGVGHL